MIKSFEGKTKEEIIEFLKDYSEYEYFVDGEKVAKDEFDAMIEEDVVVIAKENGAFYEYMAGCMVDYEYEALLETNIENANKEIEQNGFVWLNHKFERKAI